MKKSPVPSEHQEIAILAHEIYQTTGYPKGCADLHWFQAEHTLQNRKLNIAAGKKIRDEQD
ncbi:MAG: DUF2934 domain-containing protein [Chthoniobacterales bacterium]